MRNCYTYSKEGLLTPSRKAQDADEHIQEWLTCFYNRNHDTLGHLHWLRTAFWRRVTGIVSQRDTRVLTITELTRHTQLVYGVYSIPVQRRRPRLAWYTLWSRHRYRPDQPHLSHLSALKLIKSIDVVGIIFRLKFVKERGHIQLDKHSQFLMTHSCRRTVLVSNGYATPARQRRLWNNEHKISQDCLLRLRMPLASQFDRLCRLPERGTALFAVN